MRTQALGVPDGAQAKGRMKAPIELTPGLYQRHVRGGFGMVAGVEPRQGERVWLTTTACYQVYRDGWFFVERVEPAYVPECAYLHGVHVEGNVRDRLYVTVARLHVERALSAPG